MNWLTWALASAFFAGLTAILAKIGVKGIDPNLATAVRTTVVLFFTWGLVFATRSAGLITDFGKKSWVFLILSGLATGASWICYFHALQVGEASRVAPVDKMSLVFVLVLAAIFLRERLTWQGYVGVLLVTAGVILLGWKGR